MFRRKPRRTTTDALRSERPTPPGVSSAATCYRVAAVSRARLWELVESPGTDGPTRTAAAEALARTPDATERARLRTAASHCVDPRVRVAIGLLARDDDRAAAEPRANVEVGHRGS